MQKITEVEFRLSAIFSPQQHMTMAEPVGRKARPTTRDKRDTFKRITRISNEIHTGGNGRKRSGDGDVGSHRLQFRRIHDLVCQRELGIPPTIPSGVNEFERQFRDLSHGLKTTFQRGIEEEKIVFADTQ